MRTKPRLPLISKSCTETGVGGSRDLAGVERRGILGAIEKFGHPELLILTGMIPLKIFSYRRFSNLFEGTLAV